MCFGTFDVVFKGCFKDCCMSCSQEGPVPANPSGQSGRPTVVLLPGLMCTRDLFADQIAGLADKADMIVAETRKHANLPDMARAILNDAPPHFALAGLSMGGYLAFEILRQAPERVDKLALLGSNARADRPAQIKQRLIGIQMAKVMGCRAAQGYLLPWLVHKKRLSDRELVARIMAMADGTGAPAFERQQRAIIGRPDNRPFLAQIKCPTLIIVGEQDALTPVKVAREMAEGIADARVEIIPDCGHLSSMERPEQVNRYLSRWLAE